MTTSFPTGLDNFTDPGGTEMLGASTPTHSQHHANLNDAIEAIEAKVGVNSSAVASSLDKRVADLEAAGGGSHSLLDEVHATTTVVNTTTDTNLYSFTLPTDLAAGDVLRLHAQGDYLNNSGSAVSQRLRLKLGATTVIDAASIVSIATSVNRRRWVLDAVLVVETTSAQRGDWTYLQGLNNATVGYIADNLHNSVAGAATATEDLTSAKTLAFTVQHGAASANIDMRLHAATLEKIT